VVKVVRSTIIDAPCDAVWAIVRDFDNMPTWHPAIKKSIIERQRSSEVVGCVRLLTMPDGANVREQLLTLSDLEMSFSYCMLDTPIALFNYVAHVRLLPVTDGNRTFWQWDATFDTRPGEADTMSSFVGDNVFVAGFEAIKKHPSLLASH
jgi:ligand-binding SRPBCC domain-containing protein